MPFRSYQGAQAAFMPTSFFGQEIGSPVDNMGDIQQWRKKIQPSKGRTPLEVPQDQDEIDAPSTPNKKCLKKKVSSYFDFGQNTKTTSFHEDFPMQLPAWPLDELYPDPKAEDEMDSVMCILMQDPYSRLDVRYNSSLMRIFESYISMKEEKAQLEVRVREESQATQSILSKYNMEQKDWEDERQLYKGEVKRLEVLLSKASHRGLAEVTLARQESKLRNRKFGGNDRKENVFEFLEKTKRPDDRFYNQRATMKPLLLSPSDKDQKWSQKLSQKKSMTNIHAELPFGTPPNGDTRFSLTRASYLEQQAKQKARQRAVTTSTSASDDTFSSFSYARDMLGHETADSTANANAAPAASPNEDFAEIKRLASALAQRRNVDPAHVMPQLLNLFETQQNGIGTRNGSTPNALGIRVQTPSNSPTPRAFSDNIVPKRKTVASKASDLFHRLRPQLSVENSLNGRASQRRFSFEPGDDGAAQNIPPEGAVSQNHILRKSASLDVLRNNPPTTAVVDPELSPVAPSPTTSAPTEVRPPSRIPTPVYSTGSLAKPRQEREDSASSLLTAIRQFDDAGKRCSSLSSSTYSSPSAKVDEFSKATLYHEPGLSPGMRSSSSNRLLDHTNHLRANVAASGGRIPSASGENVDTRVHCKQPGARARSNHSGYSDRSNSRQENWRPMISGWDMRGPTP